MLLQNIFYRARNNGISEHWLMNFIIPINFSNAQYQYHRERYLPVLAAYVDSSTLIIVSSLLVQQSWLGPLLKNTHKTHDNTETMESSTQVLIKKKHWDTSRLWIPSEKYHLDKYADSTSISLSQGPTHWKVLPQGSELLYNWLIWRGL